MVYLISLVATLVAGYFITRNKDLKTIKGKQLIIVPGNYSTLILLLSFFAIKYLFGYLQSAQPSSYHHFLLMDVAISSLFAGYFLGRACGYVHHYRKS